VVILIAVYVCTLAIQGATVRLMFSMGRDRRLPFGRAWGKVNAASRTPTNAAIAVGVLAAIPLLITGAGAAIYIAIAATGMIYLAYVLCNVGVLVARQRGWPKRGAFFSLGSWGTIINVVAIVWGVAMVINIGIWTDPGLFGDFGNELRNTWSNPFINTFVKVGGQLLEGLPSWPVFETVVLTVIGAGAIHYLLARRGREDEVAPDVVTGEATI
jgi:amino acid transporter